MIQECIRIGISLKDAVEFIKRVESYENLEVDGFFSHMSNADAADQSHAHGQAQKFHKMVDEIRAFRPDADYRFSLANSAGLLSVKDSLFTDAVQALFNMALCHLLMYQID